MHSLMRSLHRLLVIKVPVCTLVCVLPVRPASLRSSASTGMFQHLAPAHDVVSVPTYYLVAKDKDPEVNAGAESMRETMLNEMQRDLHGRVGGTSADFDSAETDCRDNYPCEVVEEVVSVDPERPAYRLSLKLKLMRKKRDRGIMVTGHPTELGGISCSKTSLQDLTYCHQAYDAELAKDLLEHDQYCHRTAEPVDPQLCLEAGHFRRSQ